MKEDRSPFLSLLIAVFELHRDVGPGFFSTRLEEEIGLLLNVHVQFLKSEEGNINVAQYNDLKRALWMFDRVLDEIEYMYAKNSTPLSHTRLALARYQLSFLRRVKNKSTVGVVAAEKKDEETLRSVRSSRARRAMTRSAGMVRSETRQKIYQHIKKSGRLLIRDIINQFSALSERTVQRSLKEMLAEGLIQKEAYGKSHYYSAN